MTPVKKGDPQEDVVCCVAWCLLGYGVKLRIILRDTTHCSCCQTESRCPPAVPDPLRRGRWVHLYEDGSPMTASFDPPMAEAIAELDR